MSVLHFWIVSWMISIPVILMWVSITRSNESKAQLIAMFCDNFLMVQMLAWGIFLCARWWGK